MCKPRASTSFHPRARDQVLVNVCSADILTLIAGSLQIARNVVIFLKEQTGRPPRNQSGTVQALFFFCGFVSLSCKTSTKDDRCFVVKEGDSVFYLQQQCIDMQATFVSSGCTANSSCKHADLCSDAASAFQTFHLSAAKIESYNGDSAPKESLSVVISFAAFLQCA